MRGVFLEHSHQPTTDPRFNLSIPISLKRPSENFDEDYDCSPSKISRGDEDVLWIKQEEVEIKEECTMDMVRCVFLQTSVHILRFTHLYFLNTN